MTGFRLIFPLLSLCLCLVATVHAQIDVQLRMTKNTFIAGEPIPVAVVVTNNSGRDVVFQGSGRVGWMDLTVQTPGGRGLTPFGQPAFGAVKVASGKTMSRTVDLAQIYPLQSMGNFSVFAVIRLPGQTTDGYMSNRLSFNVNNARPYWSQKVGLPNKQGEGREFRVNQSGDGGKTVLFAQVVNSRTGGIVRTHSLGEALMFHKPSVTVDNRRVMHVLYQLSPEVWGHARVDSEGKFLGRDLYQRSGSAPILLTSGSGDVQVGNGVFHDPKAAAEANQKARKASDRPGFIFN